MPCHGLAYGRIHWIVELILLSKVSTSLRVDYVRADTIIAVQPNVPMNGLNRRIGKVQTEHFGNANSAIARRIETERLERQPTVILPESPMNFAYEDDRNSQNS